MSSQNCKLPINPPGIKYEEEEVFVIIETDAVIDPETMVVHLHHTSVATPAMMSPRRLIEITYRAVIHLLVVEQRRLRRLHTGKLGLYAPYDTWVGCECADIGHR